MDTRKIPAEPIEATVAWIKQLLAEEPSNVIPFPLKKRRQRREQ